ACADALRSILPMTGLSGAPAADTDTNLFSLHRRSINRRSHGRSTCCGSEKKFRNVHIRYARCAKFGCTYRGPIGVSSSRTPSESFSIHITWPTLAKAPNSAFAFKARYYCTRDGALGRNLFILGTNYLRCLDQLEKKRPTVALALGTVNRLSAGRSADLGQQCDAVEGSGNAQTLALRFLHPHHRGLAERPPSGPQSQAGRQHDDQFQLRARFHP